MTESADTLSFEFLAEIARYRCSVSVTATIRVLSAAGAAVPGVPLTLTASGATGVPARVTTNARGVASVPLTSSSVDGVSLAVRTGIASGAHG